MNSLAHCANASLFCEAIAIVYALIAVGFLVYVIATSSLWRKP